MNNHIHILLIIWVPAGQSWQTLVSQLKELGQVIQGFALNPVKNGISTGHCAPVVSIKLGFDAKINR